MACSAYIQPSQGSRRTLRIGGLNLPIPSLLRTSSHIRSLYYPHLHAHGVQIMWQWGIFLPLSLQKGFTLTLTSIFLSLSWCDRLDSLSSLSHQNSSRLSRNCLDAWLNIEFCRDLGRITLWWGWATQTNQRGLNIVDLKWDLHGEVRMTSQWTFKRLFGTNED